MQQVGLEAWGLGAFLGSPEPHLCPASLGEEEISFPPTYRYERGSRDTYAWHKQKPTGVSEKNGLGTSRIAVNQEHVGG